MTKLAPIFACMALAAAVAATACEAAPTQSERLKIGFIGPLSGPYAIYGKAALNGARMALDNPAVSSEIEIIVEDDQGQPKNTVLAFRKLADVEKVDAVISIASTLSNAVAPLAEQARIPLFAWASDPKVTAGRRYAVRTYPSGQDEGRAAAHVANERGYENVGVYTVVSDYASSVREGFLGAWPTNRAFAGEEVPVDLSDFRSILTQAKRMKIDATFLCLNPGQNANFAKQSRDLGLTTRYFGCENLNSRDEALNAGGALDDAWFVTVDVAPKFRDEYKAKFMDEDVLSGAAIHFDLFTLLAAVYEAGDSGEMLVQKMLDSGPQAGAISHYSYVKTAADQYLQARLVPQSMAALLIGAR